MSGSNVILGSYIAFALATLIIFWIRPTTQAILISCFGGWMLLPVTHYPKNFVTVQQFTVDVIGVGLPSALLITKALVVPVVVLLGLGLRAPRRFVEFRPNTLDAAMMAFCLTPLLPMLAGKVTVASAIAQTGYLVGVWGGTWMIGRLALCDLPDRKSLIWAIGFSGFTLLPVAIIEGLRTPSLYNFVYGAHPFQGEGAHRYFGYRPLAFFEHGNQYGIWISIAALAAAFVAFRHKPFRRTYAAIATLVTLCALASQSVGAIILLLLGLVWMVIASKIKRSSIIAVGVLLALAGSVYLSGKIPIQQWAETTQIGQKALAVLRMSGRESLGYRVRRDQMAMPMIFDAPIVGYGKWDWWRPLKSHPWGLPLLIAGQFGLISLALLSIAMFGGALREMWSISGSILPIILLLAGIDACLNSFIFFPAILAAAALAAPYVDSRRRVGEVGNADVTEQAANQSIAGGVL